MSRSRFWILAALASLLLTAAVARAGLIWQTTVDPTSLRERTIDFLINSGFAPTDSGFAVISPFAAPGDPNTSGGGAPGGGNSGGNTGDTGGTSGDPNNSGSTGDTGGGSVAPEPGTMILTGAGIGCALLLTRRKRKTDATSQD